MGFLFSFFFIGWLRRSKVEQYINLSSLNNGASLCLYLKLCINGRHPVLYVLDQDPPGINCLNVQFFK